MEHTDSRGAAKAATRARVIGAATRAIRRRGLAGAGIAAVMRDAGLTHGGFYAHFGSKQALAAAAVGAAFDASAARLARFEDLGAPDAVGGWIDMYLAPAHRDGIERGCMLPVLAGEGARGDDAVRAALAAGHARLSGRLAGWLSAMGRPAAPALAASMLAEAVGAVALARLLGATPASDALLAASRAALRARAGLTA